MTGTEILALVSMLVTASQAIARQIALARASGEISSEQLEQIRASGLVSDEQIDAEWAAIQPEDRPGG